MKRVLTQQEIDAAFQGSANLRKESDKSSTSYDFSRLDRIPKSQLRAIHLLHENFARNLASSLSAYLRTYILLNLASIEQISYSEFVEGISAPSCIAYIGLQPYDGTAVLELSPALVFDLMEMLLGGGGKGTTQPKRKITEIEESLVQMLLRIVLQDLREAWKTVTDINFTVQSLASEPQWLHVLAPAEAVVVIAIEMRVGSNSGLLNLALPSIFIKRLRDKFEQLQQVRRAESTERDQVRVSHSILSSRTEFEAVLSGGTMSLGEFLGLEVGRIIVLGSGQPTFSGILNGYQKWTGRAVSVGEKRAFQIVGEM